MAARLRNLGPQSQKWLAEIGIETREEIEKLGSVEVYRLLKEKGYPVSLNLAYAIEAMLADLDWKKLPPDVKAELRMAIRNL